MKKLIILFFVLLVACASAQMESDTPFDPGAMRKDGSNAAAVVGVSSMVASVSIEAPTSTIKLFTGYLPCDMQSAGYAIGIVDSGVESVTVLGSISVATPVGSLYITSGAASAIINISNGVAAKTSGASSITNTKDTGASLNVYVESGTLKIQNLTGVAVDVRAGFWGIRLI